MSNPALIGDLLETARRAVFWQCLSPICERIGSGPPPERLERERLEAALSLQRRLGWPGDATAPARMSVEELRIVRRATQRWRDGIAAGLAGDLEMDPSGASTVLSRADLAGVDALLARLPGAA